MKEQSWIDNAALLSEMTHRGTLHPEGDGIDYSNLQVNELIDAAAVIAQLRLDMGIVGLNISENIASIILEQHSARKQSAED